MKPAPFDLVQPTSLDEAIGHLSGADGMAKPMAGGQSLVPMLNLRLAPLEKVVDLSRIAELKRVSELPDKVVFGACVTHAAIEDGLAPDPAGGLMRRIAAKIAYRAIRNRGTIGGSVALADPAADWVSTMILLDAVMQVKGVAGMREIPATDFVLAAYTTALGEEELLVGLAVPRLSPSARCGYSKMCRKTGEFANSVAMAVNDPARGYCRVVLGATGGAPIVLRQTQDRFSRGQRNVREAVDADLAGHAAFDEFEREIHRASILAALKEAAAHG